MKLWNSLPENIRERKLISCFKRKIVTLKILKMNPLFLEFLLICSSPIRLICIGNHMVRVKLYVCFAKFYKSFRNFENTSEFNLNLKFYKDAITW